MNKKLSAINYRAFLDELYPESSIIKGTVLPRDTLYPKYIAKATNPSIIDLPVTVPYIVTAFPELWTVQFDAPTTISMDDTVSPPQTRQVTKFQIDTTNRSSVLYVYFDTQVNTPTSGIYYFKLSSDAKITYSWRKNNIKFVNAPNN